MATSHGFVTDVTTVTTDLPEEELQDLQEEVNTIFTPTIDPLDMDKELRLRAEEELHEDPERLKYEIQELKRLIEQDALLNSRLDDVFLAAFLRGRKHDVTKAFECLKNSYEFKALYPDFYSYAYPSKKSDLFSQEHFGSLPGPDRKGRKICCVMPGRMDLDLFPLSDSFKIGTSMVELMLNDLQIQVTGVTVIFDLAELTIMQQARMATPTSAWHLAMVAQDRIPLRVKAIHIVNQPFYFNALYAVFKPFLKKKLRKRIFVHGKDMTSLHKHIAPENLPARWGGTRTDFDARLTKVLLQMNEHKLKEWAQFTYKVYG